jgi:hypothetical protein
MRRERRRARGPYRFLVHPHQMCGCRRLRLLTLNAASVMATRRHHWPEARLAHRTRNEGLRVFQTVSSVSSAAQSALRARVKGRPYRRRRFMAAQPLGSGSTVAANELQRTNGTYAATSRCQAPKRALNCSRSSLSSIRTRISVPTRKRARPIGHPRRRSATAGRGARRRSTPVRYQRRRRRIQRRLATPARWRPTSGARGRTGVQSRTLRARCPSGRADRSWHERPSRCGVSGARTARPRASR